MVLCAIGLDCRVSYRSPDKVLGADICAAAVEQENVREHVNMGHRRGYQTNVA